MKMSYIPQKKAQLLSNPKQILKLKHRESPYTKRNSSKSYQQKHITKGAKNPPK